MSDDWDRVKDVFQALAGRAPAERAGLLEATCRDDDVLRGEILSLLAAHDEASGFLSQPAVPTGDFASPVVVQGASPVGRRIGPYELREEIAHGGMGTVYAAVRADDAFRKTVALKLVHGGPASEGLTRRFLQERQILARLQHPNIASILDGGTTGEGQPYLVMELVHGQPIDRYCSVHGLSIRQRVTLFRTVCGAIHYAHQNLVIHRDLKPANVLVTEDGAPKLLDFGIAKLFGAAVDPEDAPTATLLPMMTPEYASPEQVKGTVVTTASDVYSLGVVLYELLSGHRPYAVRAGSLQEIVKVVCDSEPRAPSFAARTRQGAPTRPATVASELRGDLDSIILKALRKEPARRYLSAHDLSEDLRRYLERLPVKARNDTLGYRTSKLFQRHAKALVGVALLVVSLLGGLAATLREAQVAEANRERAERRFQEVRQLARWFLFDLSDEIARIPGTTTVRKQVVAKALEYLDGLARETRHDPALLRELGAAYLKVGDVQGNPNNPNLGDTAGALASYQKALALYEGLTTVASRDPADVGLLAQSLGSIGEMQVVTGDLPSALSSIRRELAIREEQLASRPKDVEARSDLALGHFKISMIRRSSGDLRGAEESSQKALALREALVAEDPTNTSLELDLARSLVQRAGLWVTGGRAVEAVAALRRVVEIRRAAMAKDPARNWNRHELSTAYNDLGQALLYVGDVRAAVASYEKALAISRDMVAADRGNVQARWQLALNDNSVGTALVDLDRPAESLPRHREALAIFEALLAADSTSEFYLYGQANTYQLIGEALQRLGEGRGEASVRATRLREARGAFARSQALFADLKVRAKGSAVSWARDAERVARGVSECDASLAQLEGRSTSR